MNSSIYNKTDFKNVLITNPKFDAANPLWKIELPHVAEEYCFTATAINANGVESNPSKEVGNGKTCGQTEEDDGGGGGGGCFIWEMEAK